MRQAQIKEMTEASWKRDADLLLEVENYLRSGGSITKARALVDDAAERLIRHTPHPNQNSNCN